MADIEKNDDMAGDATDLLETQLKGKEKVEALLSALVLPIQDAEDDIFEIRNRSQLDNATGDMLDQWGALVDLTRQGRADSEYLRLVKAKIAINISKGTINEVADIFNLLTTATHTDVYEVFPRQVDLFCNADLSTYLSSDEESFAFDGGTDGAGFGDLFDTSVGGVWATLASIVDAGWFYSVMDKVLCAGYRIGAIIYLPDSTGDAFEFDGGSDGDGFGSLSDSDLGGSWATIL